MIEKMNKLHVGVIGTGYLGKFHAEKYGRIEEVDLVGVVDIDRQKAEEVAEKLGTTPYVDYEELFGKVDAVSIVVPTPIHHSVARDFLKHDVDVLLEKPMTSTLEEADELIAIAASKGLIIQVGHLERYNPAVVSLRDIVKQPKFIESHRLSVYNSRGTDVSVVLDLMIHDIDLILNFVRSKIRNIHAAGIPVISDHVDIANARLEFESGCVANVTASRISAKNERKIRFFQRDAYISVDFAKSSINVVSPKDDAQENIIPGMEARESSFSKGDALEDEIRAFIKSVTNRETPEVSGKVGRDVLNIALSIMDQIKTTSTHFME